MRFRYRHCYVSVMMRLSVCFITPLLVLGAIWVWDHCCKPWVSATPAAYLLCSTAIQREVRATSCFCSCKLAFHSVESVLLLCFNAQPYVFAVVNCVDVVAYWLCSTPRFQCVAGYFCTYETCNCSVLVLSSVFCSCLLTWSAD